jgi:ribose/xylose/arabinose/galactoside ABC-type transport system permease subunit
VSAPARGSARADRLRSRTDLQAAALLAIVLGLLAAFQQDALTNYGVTLERIAGTGLVALGLTPLLILGEIDLSVGATMAIAGVIAAKVGPSPWLGLSCGLLAACAVGCINAFLVMTVRVTSFIATLGTMIVLQGVALAVSASAPVPFGDANLVLQSNRSLIGQLTAGVVLLLIGAAVLHVVLSRTKPGRDLYVIGGNRAAAAAADIPVRRRTWMAFIGCSAFAGAAGLMGTLTQAAADPNVGSSVLLTALAAAVLGGAYLQGGRGSASGTLMASIAIGGVSVGLELHGASASIEAFVVGAILVVAVTSNRDALDRLRQAVVWRPMRRWTKPAGTSVDDPNHL